MFLKKVYRHNKWMFAGFVIFILLQLVCFYKKGMVFSPFYNYGMYSEVIDPQPVYTVTKVYVDDQLLEGNKFSPQSWDRIHFNIQQALIAECNLHFYVQEVSRIFKKFHLPVPDPSKFYNYAYTKGEILQKQEKAIADWQAANNATVYHLQFQWNGDLLLLKDTLKEIIPTSFLCQ